MSDGAKTGSGVVGFDGMGSVANGQAAPPGFRGGCYCEGIILERELDQRGLTYTYQIGVGFQTYRMRSKTRAEVGSIVAGEATFEPGKFGGQEIKFRGWSV